MAHASARRSPVDGVGDPARVAAGREGLVELTLALPYASTVEDVMSVLVLEAERVFGSSSAVAYAHRGDALELVAAVGRAEDAHEWLRSVPLGAHIPVARATREGAPGWYESRAALAAAFPGWVGRVPHVERFGALAALPLRVDGRTLGAIGLAFDEERPFGPEERAVLSAAVAEGALAFDRVRLLEVRCAAGVSSR